MSYILDALRKSDRERRLGEVPPLESSVTSEDAEQRRPHWALWLIIALIAINAATVSFLLLVRDNPSAPPSADVSPDIPKQATEPSIPPPQAIARAPAPADAGADEKLTSKTSPVSISDMLAQKKQPPKKEPAPRPPSPPRAKRQPAKPQPVAGPIAPRAPSRPKARVMPGEDAIADLPAVIRPQTDDTVKSDTGNSIPYLKDLPRDFQRRVPSLKINVYVSSKNPAERFIVANMTKYRPGQKIAEGLTLEEIEPASMILRFEEQRFRMRRP